MRPRIFALLLAFLMVFQAMSFSTGVAAAKNADSRVVNFLTAFDVMGVDEKQGNFWDDSLVRRSEMAMILCKIYFVEPKASDTPMFTDVAEDDRPYVETAVRNGYMAGYSSDRFGANDFITNEQLIKIFVKALGGEGLANNIGGYPSGYMLVGKRLGLLKNISGAETDPVRRIDVANMIYDAMHADMYEMVTVSEDETFYNTIPGKTFLSEVLDIYRISGIVEANKFTSVLADDGEEDGRVRINGYSYNDSGNLAGEYLGYKVTAYVRQPEQSGVGEIVYIENYYENADLTIDADDITKDLSESSTQVKYFDGNRKKNATVSSVADMIYNEKAVACDMSILNGIDSGYVKLIDNNNDKVYDVVIIRDFTPAVVYKVDADMNKIFFSYGREAMTLDDNAVYDFYRNGQKVTLADVSAGEVISIAESKNETGKKAYRFELSSNTVKGTVKSIRKGNNSVYVKINGTDYKVGTYCESLIEKNYLNVISGGSFGTFYLDFRGEIVYYEMNESNIYVGYLIQSAVKSEVFSRTILVMIYTPEFGITTYNLTDKIAVNGDKMDVSDVADNIQLMQKFNTQQLIQFKQNEKGELLDINFPVEGYDEQRFSLDVNASAETSNRLTMTSKSLFENKYYLSNETKVFCVPGKIPGVVDIEPEHYTMYPNTYFADIGSRYAVCLYDIEKNGHVGYVLYNRWWNIDHIGGGSSLALVTECFDGVDEAGIEIKGFVCLDEAGKEFEIKAPVTESTSEVKAGDVIQYSRNYLGKIHGVQITHSVDSELYAPINTDAVVGTYKLYGAVVRCTNESMQLSASDERSMDMSPMDVDRVVLNNCHAVYRFNKERGISEVISFEEINPNDKVFAFINEDNISRMIVVYE